MLKNKLGIEHKISKIEYTVYEDDSFVYIFTPYYQVIELLDTDIFQGIPGLDLDLKKEQYIRNNVIPVFISERTPGPNRENLQEILEEAGMKYLNPLEWLIKTDYVYSGDEFYVIEYKNRLDQAYILQTGMHEIGSTKYIEEILSNIALGNRINIDGKDLNTDEISMIYKLLTDVLSSNRKMQKRNRQIGIEKAESLGKYKGRKKKNIDMIKYQTAKEEYLAGEIGVNEAAAKLGISRSTFFRRLKD